MAVMLEQLGLDVGQRVLEIGTGSGYNAALIAWIVGDSGTVVTIDVEPDLTDRARASLAAVGTPQPGIIEGHLISRRPNSVLVAGWPTSA
jgi:protein-L-isoaspartate(D-aspartate) O-methyltransferase